MVAVGCHSDNNSVMPAAEFTSRATGSDLLDYLKNSGPAPRNMLVSTDRVVLQTPGISMGCRMYPLCMHRDSQCRSSSLAYVLDLFTCGCCHSKTAFVQEGLGHSSEAFISLQMTSP